MKVAIIGSEGRMGKLRKKILENLGVEVVSYDIGMDYAPVLGCDGFFVCTPLFAHRENILDLAKLSKPIFCEKPLAGSVREIEEIFNTCENNGVPLYVAWQRRFHKKYQDSKYCLENVGNDWRVMHIVSMDNPSPPEHVLNIPNYIHSDFMGHDINEMLFFSNGELPESVEVLDKKVFGNVFDYSKVICHFSNKRVAYLEGYTKNPGNFYGQDLKIQTPGYTIDVPGGSEKRSFPEFYKDAFEAEVEMFVKVVEGKYNLPSQREQNVRTAMVIEMVIAESNRNYPIEFIGGGNFGSYQKKNAEDVVDFSGPHTRNQGRTLSELCADPQVRRAYVCSPDNTHDEIAAALLEAGKGVLCEKPVFGIDSLIQNAEKTNVPFMIGFQRRFDVRYLEAVKYTTSRNVSTVTVRSHDPVPFDSDSRFVTANSLIHDFDTLNCLFPGAEFTPTSVQNKGSTIVVSLDVKTSYGVVKATVDYRKEWDTYLQEVVVDGKTFGFDYILENGVKVFDSYSDAYRKEFITFAQMNSFDKDLAESYRPTVKMVQDTIALVR
jgi:predicted dehydrogenase